MRLDKDKLKEELTIDDIHKILSHLGCSDNRHDLNGNPIYRTVCHNHSNGSHKLYYYDEIKLFKCYTNCNNMDIYEVVIKAKEQQGFDYSFSEALKFVSSVTGKSPM